MNKKKLSLLFCVVVILLISGCAEEKAYIPKIDSAQPSPQQEVTKTTVPAPAENNQPEEKVELTFEQEVWKKRIDAAMAPSYCPPVTKVEYPSSYYQGPLIDSHYHLPSLPDSLPGQEEGEEEIFKQYYGRNYVYEDDEEDEDDEEPYLG